jgi:hypothetical protein
LKESNAAFITKMAGGFGLENGHYIVPGSRRDSDDEEISHLSDSTGVMSSSPSSTRSMGMGMGIRQFPNPLNYLRKKVAKKKRHSRLKGEGTPLLPTVHEQGVAARHQVSSVSYTRKEQITSPTSGGSEDSLLLSEVSPMSGENTSRSPSRGEAHWKTLRKHVDQGDVLLQGVVGASPIDDAPSRDRRVQDYMNEIRNGMEFSLTHGLLATLVYMVLSIVCYAAVFQPDWNIVDACYFAVVTFTTVGYGDLAPTTRAGQLFTCLYTVTGVACLGIALGVLGSNLVEAQDKLVAQADELMKVQVLSVFDQREEPQNAPEKEEQPTTCCKDNSTWKSLPLLVLLVFLASLIGRESGWDSLQTMYYLIITGKRAC